MAAGSVFITMIWGAFMSGLDGGKANTFPLMDGRLFPPGALSMVPVWLNLFENIGLVQWLHRVSLSSRSWRSCGRGGATAKPGRRRSIC